MKCGEKIYLTENSFEKAYISAGAIKMQQSHKKVLSLFPDTQFQRTAEINEIAGQLPSRDGAMKGEEIQLRTGN